MSDPAVISDWPAPKDTGKPPLVELFKLTKRFGAFTALENASLRLEPGTLPCTSARKKPLDGRRAAQAGGFGHWWQAPRVVIPD